MTKMTYTKEFLDEIVEGSLEFWIDWNYCVGRKGYEDREEWLDEDEDEYEFCEQDGCCGECPNTQDYCDRCEMKLCASCWGIDITYRHKNGSKESWCSSCREGYETDEEDYDMVFPTYNQIVRRLASDL
jgi:hypothetical protein